MEKLVRENDVLLEVRRIVKEDGLSIPDDSCLRIASHIRDNKSPAISLHGGQESFWIESDIRSAFYKTVAYDITKQSNVSDLFSRAESLLSMERIELSTASLESVVSKVHQDFLEGRSGDVPNVALKEALVNEVYRRVNYEYGESQAEKGSTEKLLRETDITAEVQHIAEEDGLNIPYDDCSRIALGIRYNKVPAIVLNGGQEIYWKLSDIRSEYYKLIFNDIIKQPIGYELFNRIESMCKVEEMELNRDIRISVASRIQQYYNEDMSDNELKNALYSEVSRCINNSANMQPSSGASEVSAVTQAHTHSAVYNALLTEEATQSKQCQPVSELSDVFPELPTIKWDLYVIITRIFDKRGMSFDKAVLYAIIIYIQEIHDWSDYRTITEENVSKVLYEAIPDSKLQSYSTREVKQGSEKERIHILAHKLAAMCPKEMAKEFDDDFERALYVAQYYFKNN